MLRRLLQARPQDLNVTQPTNGATPLIQAAYYGANGALELLLSLGADAACTNARGETAMDAAVTGGNKAGEAMLKAAAATARRHTMT